MFFVFIGDQVDNSTFYPVSLMSAPDHVTMIWNGILVLATGTSLHLRFRKSERSWSIPIARRPDRQANRDLKIILLKL